MTGIIGAMDIETQGLIQKMTDTHTEEISGTVYTVGRLGNHDCVVAKCGIGKVNAAIAAQTMILRFSPDRIINTGIGGSTSKKTHIGYVVIADHVVQHQIRVSVLFAVQRRGTFSSAVRRQEDISDGSSQRTRSSPRVHARR